MSALFFIAASSGVLFGTGPATRSIEIYPGLSPYDTRTLARPYNPGPKIIREPIPETIYEHKNLHLPDPACLAGCRPK